jgi:hypothetical protein
MLCPVCHGQRLVVIGGRQEPCAECGGLGVLHCCEGLVEQPDFPGEAAGPQRQTAGEEEPS